ncbi:COMM domain-containing protein 2 [Myotis davidii]|uniref:COMM domain-containing protein 2 n=1 Tax=Myotis davidii TaxID=225400 RepID=L5MED6_MYODS|nr:COMM domain-containing protein 2 [Myotis davidii]
MLLDLSEEHKEHLAFLPRVNSSVVAEFGRIAVEFLRRGANPKIYEGAARKLNKLQAQTGWSHPAHRPGWSPHQTELNRLSGASYWAKHHNPRNPKIQLK